MSIAKLLFPFVQVAVRRTRHVALDDLRRNVPVSRMLGTERGTAIDRRYIEQFLREHAGLIRGRTLEVASSGYIRRFHSGATSFDVLHVEPGHAETTIVGDLTQPASLPEARVDCFVCTQTFNFVYDLHAAIDGAYHLLAPGGVLLATLGGASPISRYDMDRWGDYWRFTDVSARRAFSRRFSELNVLTYGNVLAVKAIFDGLSIEDLPEPELLDRVDPDFQVVIGVVAKKAS